MLTRTAVLLCAFNLLGVLLYDPSAGGLWAFLMLYGCLATVSFVVIWYYRQGQNWARWLVLATSALSLLNIAFLPPLTAIATALVIAEAGFGAWLLYWLNTKPVALVLSKHASTTGAWHGANRCLGRCCGDCSAIARCDGRVDGVFSNTSSGVQRARFRLLTGRRSECCIQRPSGCWACSQWVCSTSLKRGVCTVFAAWRAWSYLRTAR